VHSSATVISPSPTPTSVPKARWVPIAVFFLLALLFTQLWITARQQSMTVDEGNHTYSGYMSWKHADFGLNPEHPPLVKLLATIPLLRMSLKEPAPRGIYYKIDAYIGGRELLLWNGSDRVLFPARMAASVLALLLALLIFLTAGEMFGTNAGLLALAVVVFDPNLLAHGALVTTDVGVSCFFLATIYAFYRYVKSPSIPRLVLTGLAAGLTWGAKHSGVFVFIMLAALIVSELVRWFASHKTSDVTAWKQVARFAIAYVVIILIAATVLWSLYGFRYQARAAGSVLHPPLEQLVQPLKPNEAKLVLALARWKVLPESYLFGATDVRRVGNGAHTFILGKVYFHGVWFYFPIVMLIKCTETLLALIVLAAIAVVLNRLWFGREFLFLIIPLLIYLAIAMSSTLNTGVRHIMPVYAFLWPLAGGVAWTLTRKNPRWAYVFIGLVVLQFGSSLLTFRSHMAYANVFWGGPSNTHNLLTDSNVDWGQQLHAVQKYLQARNIQNCWFGYIAEGETEYSTWGIPCKPLPNLDAPGFSKKLAEIPSEIDGPVLISADELTGYESGPGPLNPYENFLSLPPTATIEGGVLVYDGHFSVPRLAAFTNRFLNRNEIETNPQHALAVARQGVILDPDNAESWTFLGRALKANQQKDEARAAFQKAIEVAESVEPEYQSPRIPEIQKLLAGL
jgi:hypothetical protein